MPGRENNVLGKSIVKVFDPAAVLRSTLAPVLLVCLGLPGAALAQQSGASAQGESATGEPQAEGAQSEELGVIRLPAEELPEIDEESTLLDELVVLSLIHI